MRCILIFTILLPVVFAGEGGCEEYLFNLIREGDFEKQRGYAQYVNLLGKDFESFYLNLGENDHVLDLGSGESLAAMNMAGLEPNYDVPKPLSSVPKLLSKKSFPFVTGVDLRPYAVSKGKFRLITGLFNKLTLDELLPKDGSKYKMIIETFGTTAYTSTLWEDLNKIFSLLSDDGVFYLYMGSSNYIRDRGFKKEVIQNIKKGKFTEAVVFEGFTKVLNRSIFSPVSVLYNTVIEDSGKFFLLHEWLMRSPKVNAKLIGKSTLKMKKRKGSKAPFFDEVTIYQVDQKSFQVPKARWFKKVN